MTHRCIVLGNKLFKHISHHTLDSPRLPPVRCERQYTVGAHGAAVLNATYSARHAEGHAESNIVDLSNVILAESYRSISSRHITQCNVEINSFLCFVLRFDPAARQIPCAIVALCKAENCLSTFCIILRDVHSKCCMLRRHSCSIWHCAHSSSGITQCHKDATVTHNCTVGMHMPPLQWNGCIGAGSGKQLPAPMQSSALPEHTCMIPTVLAA